MILPFATWMDGIFTLGMMAVVFALAQFLAWLLDLGLAAGARWRRPMAPAVFIGWQEGLPATDSHPGVPTIALYNLTAAVGRHPVGSTVSGRTLERHGFRTPALTRPNPLIARSGAVSRSS